ncbi:hypothetical protein [Fervidibacillus albus]|uniref:Lipoprotein n=1 Tax=Fervidibacillus albus TaxID=2980026 RepID=A0A9E8LTI2_9BACI|nr:hypothetical protein [Fervidibacillus albus]WAA09095.1 hypothetical protein OE104_10910 [Fervidibacillus albus]
MKKFIRLILLLCTFSFAFGCSNNSHPMTLYIKNNSDFNVYSIELTWYQNGSNLRTSGGMKADGAAFEKGESVPFYFDRTDFVPGKKTTFEIAVFVDPNLKNKIVISPPIPLYFTNNKQYYLAIRGNRANHFTLHFEGKPSE